jgi:hypothetical protein
MVSLIREKIANKKDEGVALGLVAHESELTQL